MQARRGAAGTVQFLGQLRREGLLDDATVLTQLDTLLPQQLSQLGTPRQTGALVEADDAMIASVLLTTVGAALDGKVAHRARVCDCFAVLSHFASAAASNGRTAALVQDLLELREHRWGARRAEEGPKRIAEVQMVPEIPELQMIDRQHRYQDNKKQHIFSARAATPETPALSLPTAPKFRVVSRGGPSKLYRGGIVARVDCLT